jgi:hypothetical protein
MNEVSLFRLYLLRALYLLIVVGLGTYVIPDVIFHKRPWSPHEGVVQCMLFAFWALSIVGIRYPLQMLPILLWELLWKSTWLIVVALPLWLANKMDDPAMLMAPGILGVIIFPFIIPWGYVFKRYVQQSGDRWR